VAKPSQRAGIYGRVSIDTREGRSVDSQLGVGRRWANQQQHHIVGEYRDDGISAYDTRKQRPDWQRVMADIAAKKLDILWVWEVSRASRDREVWAALMKACARSGVLISVNGKDHDVRRPDDGFLLDLGMAMAVRESAMISERVKRATDSAAEQGRAWGSIPYGFRREYDPASGEPARQVPDEETAPIVQEVVARVLAGESLHGISVDLNRRGVPTPQMVRDRRLKRVGVQRGGWNNPKLRKLLGSPTMAGWRVHRGVRHSIAWEPLVSVVDYEAVLRIINDPRRRTQRGTAACHLLSGIGKCAVCGGWLRHYSNRGRPSYSCNGLNGTGTGHVSRAAPPLDAFVALAVVERLSRPDWAAAFTAPVKPSGRMEVAAQELTDARAELAEYEALAGTPSGVPAATFVRIATRISSRIAELEAEIAPLPVLPTAVLEMAGADAAAVWDTLGIEQRRIVVRALCTVTVLPVTRKGVRGFDPDTVRLEWLGAA